MLHTESHRLHEIENILHGKKSILAVVSHPDDFEDYFSGTMFYGFDKNLIKPENVHILVCTDGGKGGRDKEQDQEKLKETRKDEQSKSLNYMGIPHDNCHFLDFEDGYIHNVNNVLTERISYFIRKLKPDLMLTHNGFEAIIDKPNGTYYVHKDHRTVGQAVLDAAYPYSRDLLFFPHHHQEGLSGHMILEILLAETAYPNVKVDVTEYMPQKIGLIKQFMSQVDSEAWLTKYFKDTTYEDGCYIENFRYLRIII
jgi:LmbE family N-acetylglucosaminyl deacetylase